MALHITIILITTPLSILSFYANNPITQQSTTNNQQPTTNNQQPTTLNQSTAKGMGSTLPLKDLRYLMSLT
tara:strand:- start:123 stop:335 length:213 start_codon:yes stop_codon:yes gene_type:complete